MATIKEDYVSFETAKLLKEKGFDEPCIAYWFYMIGAEPIFNYNMPRQVYNNKSDTIEIIGCPTLQMVMKWLREVHLLHIWIGCNNKRHLPWYYEIHNIKTGMVAKIGGINCGSYEIACEVAIKYCLEILI